MNRFYVAGAVIACISMLGRVNNTPPDNRYADITLPPVATFGKYCARCHGYEGSAYGKNFGTLNYDSLKSITEDMMFGPAGLTPDSVSVEAMVAYNSALSRNVPFASVLNARSYFDKRNLFLLVETSPDAQVDHAERLTENSIDTLLWRIPQDSLKEGALRIRVTRNHVSSFIRFPEELWSR